MADELKVPSQKQRAERSGGSGEDDLRVVVARDDAPVHGSAGHDDVRVASGAGDVRERAGGPDGSRAEDEHGRDPHVEDPHPENPHLENTHVKDSRTEDTHAEHIHSEDIHAKDYKDPYTAPPEDVPTAAAGPGPMARGEETGVADGMPAHAAPQETALFDRDPADVQARWRDLQAGFVDDPGDAVKRADGLVGEVVESLTSALTRRTSELRGRWQGAGETDTEQLRQALREYRGVLERLLAVSSSGTSVGTNAGTGSGAGAGLSAGTYPNNTTTTTTR